MSFCNMSYNLYTTYYSGFRVRVLCMTKNSIRDHKTSLLNYPIVYWKTSESEYARPFTEDPVSFTRVNRYLYNGTKWVLVLNNHTVNSPTLFLPRWVIERINRWSFYNRRTGVLKLEMTRFPESRFHSLRRWSPILSKTTWPSTLTVYLYDPKDIVV